MGGGIRPKNSGHYAETRYKNEGDKVEVETKKDAKKYWFSQKEFDELSKSITNCRMCRLRIGHLLEIHEVDEDEEEIQGVEEAKPVQG